MFLAGILAVLVALFTYVFWNQQVAWGLFNELKERVKKFKLSKNGKKFRLLCSHAWPNDRLSQIKMVFCIIVMIVRRFLDILVPLCGKWIVDDITERKTSFLWGVISMSFGVLCLQGGVYVDTVLRATQDKIRSSMKKQRELEIHSAIYDRILHLPYSTFVMKGQKEIHRILHQSPMAIIGFPEYIIFELIPIFVSLATALYFFYESMNISIAIVMLGIALIDVRVNQFVGQWKGRNFHQVLLCHGFNVYFGISSVQSFETIKYFCNEKAELQGYQEKIIRECEQQEMYQNSHEFPELFRRITRDCLKLLGSFFIGYQKSITDSNMSMGDYLLFAHYLDQFIRPILTAQQISKRLTNYLDDVEPYYKILQTPIETSEALREGHDGNMEYSGGLKVDHVTFSYTEGEVVLDDVSFEIPEGKKIALVGPSGSGKSTLIRILYKLLEPQEGAILLNDINIKELDVKTYRNSISVVPQDCTLMYSTVRNNIHYGRLNAPDEEVEHAAGLAKIDKLLKREDEQEKNKQQKKEENSKKKSPLNIWSLFTGFDADYNPLKDIPSYDEDQSAVSIHRMSGGEKQRVAIARALLKNPKYLLMDEATSSLDSVTEKQIQTALMDVTKDKTCVLVAHRLSTIAHVDNIVVLKEGKVVEQGRHKDLLSLDGVYAEMWKLQQGEVSMMK